MEVKIAITEMFHDVLSMIALIGSVLSLLVIGFYIFFVRKSSPFTQNEDPEGKRYMHFKLHVYKLSICGVFFLSITAMISILVFIFN